MVIQGEPGAVIWGKEVQFETNWLWYRQCLMPLRLHILTLQKNNMCNTIVLISDVDQLIEVLKELYFIRDALDAWTCCFLRSWFIIIMTAELC
jgi:hypothetical protein